MLSHKTYVSGLENSTEDFEAPTSRGYMLHQEKENEGWFSCVRGSISIFGGGKLWLVGVRKTSNSYVLLQLQLLRVWDEKSLRGVCLVYQEKGGHCLHVTSWDHVQPRFNATALSSIRLWVRRQMKGLIKKKGKGWGGCLICIVCKKKVSWFSCSPGAYKSFNRTTKILTC